MVNGTDAFRLKNSLVDILGRPAPPEGERYLQVLKRACDRLDGEEPTRRPPDAHGHPGGIVYLDQDLPTIIVPDLHARMEFFLSLMLKEDPSGFSTLERLEHGSLQVVCVGDGFHAERRAAERWVAAYEEYLDGFESHDNIDEEMRESLGVMEMVMEVKSAYPDRFHFLKGNHENIANEEGEGNHPFRKFTYEGMMVAHYVWKFYGEEFLGSYYAFEKRLPLLAVGRNFLVTHAEPAAFFRREDVLQYRDRPDVVEGLTWTDNGASEPGSVERMLEHFLGEERANTAFHFGGHRPVRGLYTTRSGGRYVQLHNPDRWIIAEVKSDREIDLSEDIVEIESDLYKIYNHKE